MNRKKRGRKRKLSAKGMKFFSQYALKDFSEPLYIIISRPNAITGLNLSKIAGRKRKHISRCKNKFNLGASFIKKNQPARIL